MAGFPVGGKMRGFTSILVATVLGGMPSAMAGQKARVVSVRVQALDGAKFEKLPFQEIVRDADKQEARNQIREAGYSCTALDELWVAVFTLKKQGARIYKANCALGVAYQVTVIDGRGYVKPWAGVIMGTP